MQGEGSQILYKRLPGWHVARLAYHAKAYVWCAGALLVTGAGSWDFNQVNPSP